MKFIVCIFALVTACITTQFAFGADDVLNSNMAEMAISKNGAFVSDELEARATTLFRHIKCPICIAQSVAESDAEISKSLRSHIRTEIAKGKTDQNILDNLTARYGDSILLSPPVGASTLPLWLAPWFFLLIGVFAWQRAHKPKNGSISS